MTEEELKQAVKDKEDKIRELTETLEKENKRVKNAEDLVAKWSNEVGDIRNEVGNEKKQREAAEASLEAAQKAVVEMEAKIKEASKDVEEDGKRKPVVPEVPEDIEKTLNEDQRKVGELKFSELSKEEKLQFSKDSEFRLAFFKRLKTDEPFIPDTPWSTAKSEDNGGDSRVDSILDRVFEKKNNASFVPEGPKSGILGTSFSKDSGKEKDFEEDTRVD